MWYFPVESCLHNQAIWRFDLQVMACLHLTWMVKLPWQMPDKFILRKKSQA